jgi:hypothetical protein
MNTLQPARYTATWAMDSHHEFSDHVPLDGQIHMVLQLLYVDFLGYDRVIQNSILMKLWKGNRFVSYFPTNDTICGLYRLREMCKQGLLQSEETYQKRWDFLSGRFTQHRKNSSEREQNLRGQSCMQYDTEVSKKSIEVRFENSASNICFDIEGYGFETPEMERFVSHLANPNV